MILQENHEFSQTKINEEESEKSMYEGLQYMWALPLTIKSIHQITGSGVTPIVVVYQLSINDKIGR